MERLSEQDIIAQEWDAVADTALLKFALRSDDIQAHIRRFAAAVEARVRAECVAAVADLRGRHIALNADEADGWELALNAATRAMQEAK